MATQTIEFPSSTGRTLTAKLFAVGSDTQTASQSATEATNRKGIYTASFTDIAAGDYQLVVLDGSSVPAYVGFVTLTLTTATFQVRESHGGNVTYIGGTAQTAKDLGAINVTNLNTLSGHDPGATLGTSTLTQTQVTGGAYALNSASFAFNSALPLTTQQKADVNTEADTAASDYGALKPTTAGRTLDVSATGEAGIDWANVGSPTTTVNLSGTTVDLVNAPNATAVTAIQSGLATEGADGDTLETLSDQLDTVLAKWTTAMTESYAAQGATVTPEQALYMIMQSLHEFAISSVTRTVKKLDGSTTAMTFTLDDDTAPTSTTRAT